MRSVEKQGKLLSRVHDVARRGPGHQSRSASSVIQRLEEPRRKTFQADEETGLPEDEASAEGVGAYGPNAGNEDNSPCSQSLQSYDVTVQQNRDSGDFIDGEIGVAVIAGSSAENGDRGPGPFIGDLLVVADDPDFERVR